jgi:hypothetical protein
MGPVNPKFLLLPTSGERHHFSIADFISYLKKIEDASMDTSSLSFY